MLRNREIHFCIVVIVCKVSFVIIWWKRVEQVAECLVNPFGEDEEDFDVNFLIDRNLQVMERRQMKELYN